MSTAAPIVALEDDSVRITGALRVEQLRLYDANLLTSVSGSALVAALLVAVLWGAVATERLLGWSACLGLALAARLLDWLVQQRSRKQDRHHQRPAAPGLRLCQHGINNQGWTGDCQCTVHQTRNKACTPAQNNTGAPRRRSENRHADTGKDHGQPGPQLELCCRYHGQ